VHYGNCKSSDDIGHDVIFPFVMSQPTNYRDRPKQQFFEISLVIQTSRTFVRAGFVVVEIFPELVMFVHRPVYFDLTPRPLFHPICVDSGAQVEFVQAFPLNFTIRTALFQPSPY
jgi:hypothetical protein